jgi:hypothetical protein
MERKLNLKSMNSLKCSVFGVRYSVVGRIFLVFIVFCFYSFQTPNTKPQTTNLPVEQCLERQASFQLIKSISIDAKDIQTDRIGNLYIITKSNQLYKYDSKGNLLGTLNYKYLGNISFIDASNPFELYVFYKELNEILFLDNNLAYRGEILLNDYGISQSSAIARSFDNGIWVFDNGDLQLKRMSKNGAALQMSGNIKQFVNGNLQPNFIYDNNDQVFVNDSNVGILVFNVFANFIKTIPIKHCSTIKIIEDDLFYNQSGKLMKYNLKTFTQSEFQLPDTTYIQQISIEKERLFLLKPNSVDIYSY